MPVGIGPRDEGGFGLEVRADSLPARACRRAHPTRLRKPLVWSSSVPHHFPKSTFRNLDVALRRARRFLLKRCAIERTL
jgi:hypothetical protein